MKPETLCAICERNINSLSPSAEVLNRQLELMKSKEQVEDVASITAPEATIEFKDGRTSHERCKEVYDFLNSLETPPEIVELRLKGYRAGKPFTAYMQGLYGLETPAANSKRVLAHAYAVMFDLQMHWQMGNILQGEVFDQFRQLDTGQLILRVQDISLEENALRQWFDNIAQAILSYAVILWCDAHKSEQQHKDDQEMFLEHDMYDGSWKPEMEYFMIAKRNKAIGHVTKPNWDDWNTNASYQPYREWPADWNRFQKLLRHSLYLCDKKISDELGRPAPDATDYHPQPMGPENSVDLIERAVEIFDALGPPTRKSTDPRPRGQGPYWFERVGSKWLERKEPGN